MSNRVPEVVAQVESRSQELAQTVREEIAADARRRAPVGSEADGDRHPGELRDSIEVDGDRVVASAPHANFVEHGTVFMAAIPFFAPAVVRGRQIMKAGMRRLVQ